MDDHLRQRIEPRLRILEAMIKAQDDLPALVAIVAASANSEAAAAALVTHFDVEPHQAVAMLDMQIRRMSEHERAKVIDERDGLQRELAEG